MDIPKYLLARLNVDSKYSFEVRLKRRNKIPNYAKSYFHEFKHMHWKEMTLRPKDCINTVYWTLYENEGMLYRRPIDIKFSEIDKKHKKAIIKLQKADTLPRIIAISTEKNKYIVYDGWHTIIALMRAHKPLRAYVGFTKSFSQSHRYVKYIAKTLKDYSITGDYKRYFENGTPIIDHVMKILVPDIKKALSALKNYDIIEKHKDFYVLKNKIRIKLIEKPFNSYDKRIGDFTLRLEK